MELSARNLLKAFERHRKVVNPFAAVCQCRHETSYQGRPWNSELCLKAHNLAGLKVGSDWNGQVYSKVSWEQQPSGKKYEKVSDFRRYLLWEDFVDDYAVKISRDYPVCTASADNFIGYFSGLFRGRWGAWATDLSYLDRLLDQTFALAPVFFGEAWQDKVWAAYRYAAAKGRLTSEHEERIRRRLEATIPEGVPLFEDAVPAPQPQPAQPAAKEPLVCIDPGHGGVDPGAIGPVGTKEAEINLLFARALGTELRARGYSVVMTRDGPERLASSKNADLSARYKVANDAKADAFISIHCNAATNATARGFEVYTTRGQNVSDAMATCVFEAWKAQVGGAMRPDYSDGDPDKEAGFAVIRGTRCPSCLVELAFISNPQDEQLLRDPQWRVRGAKAIADGVARFLG